jgi:anti-sigma B factor antagonist
MSLQHAQDPGRGTYWAPVITRDATRSIVSLSGELDIATEGASTHAVSAAARGHDAAVWLDLAGLTFMDSTGARLVIGARNLLAERPARRLVVICPPGPNRRVLRLTGVDQLVDVHADHASAARATTI